MCRVVVWGRQGPLPVAQLSVSGGACGCPEMLTLRPYWRPYISTQPREVRYDEARGEIVSATRKKTALCQGWYVKVSGQVITLYTLDDRSFVLQIGTVRFLVDESLEVTTQQKRWAREISFRQGDKVATIVDRTRGSVSQMLSVSGFIAAIALDDLDLGDLLGDVYTWFANRQIIPRDVFAMRLAEEKVSQAT